jgi:glycosyltransferase involved in cell wall biosynthesis
MILFVVPCYNEAERLNASKFIEFLKKNKEVNIIFSDDGSTDTTLTILEKIRTKIPNKVFIFKNKINKGKAAAVYAAFQYAHKFLTFDKIGYLDADLATSLEEGFDISTYIKNEIQFAFGSRIRKIDNIIIRKYHRFFIGRVIATVISYQLKIPVYDTQCGCKFFSKELSESIFIEPFISKWLFDVEIFHRIIKAKGIENIVKISKEIPLKLWIDTDDSKVKPSYFFKLWSDLFQINKKYKNVN